MRGGIGLGLAGLAAGALALGLDPAATARWLDPDATARHAAIAQGVDILIPGGGIPMLLFSQLHEHTVDGAPVVNGIPIVVKMAEMAVKLRRLTGLHVARTSDFIQPPPEIIEEFLSNPKGL